MMYNKVVMDHFRNPRNVGTIEDADGVGEVGNPLCGDMMTIYLRVRDDRIEDIKFQTFGCGSAIAVSSMLTELAKGRPIAEAKRITNQDVARTSARTPCRSRSRTTRTARPASRARSPSARTSMRTLTATRATARTATWRSRKG
jgi:SUF system NifU family Fe-S assembly protein